MNRNIVKITVVSLLVLSGFWLTRLYFEEFSPSNIKMNLPPGIERDISSEIALQEMPELHQALNQPYAYLGSGNQVYAFESQDGHYVLKLFKFNHLKPGSELAPISAIPLISSYIQKQETIKSRKLNRIFNAYQVAFTRDRDNSGLLHVQLSQQNGLNKVVRVNDRFGRSHDLELSGMVFAVQRKAVPLKSHIKALLEKGRLVDAKHCFRDVVDMYLREYKRGIFDHDHNVMTNLGISNGSPMRMDIGKIVYDPSFADPGVYNEDLRKVVFVRIDTWLKKHFPQYHEEILNDLRGKLNELGVLQNSFSCLCLCHSP